MAEKMVKAEDCKCCICGKKAYAFWPCIDPDFLSIPIVKNASENNRWLLSCKSLGRTRGVLQK